MTRFLFTSESATEGHPDKIADQISDAILDELIKQDPYSRVACETLVTTGLVFISGEITTKCYIDIPRIARDTIREIGYTRAKYGFDCDTCAVITSIDEQSPDIAIGVENALEIREGQTDNTGEIDNMGAGDQGMMFGYASNETEELMPLPIILAHKLARQLAVVRKNGDIPYLRPDGKVQVTVEYENHKPARIDTLVVVSQHQDDIDPQTMKEDIINKVIKPVAPDNLIDNNTRFLINPTGRFVVGGPKGDTGLTGRKNIVDTYGGMARNGGGALSGKDPTKVDRSASYAARYVAKNIVAAGLADRCEVQLAYAIGVANPISITIDTFGTGKVSDDVLINLIKNNFDLRPAAIIKNLDLRRPIYLQTAAYGHFGRTDIDLPWEKTDKAEILKKQVSID